MTFVANSDVCCQLLRLSLIGFVAVPRKSIVSQLFFYQELRGLGRPSGGGRRWVPAAVPRTGRSGLLIRDRGQHPTSLILILLPCHVQSRHEVGKPQRRIFFYFICSPTGQSFCLLGWSDLALFAIFEKLHVSADQVY